MRVVNFISRWLSDYRVIGHQARGQALLRATDALIRGRRLCLTDLGRNRDGSANVKHHIKAIDRLLGNPHLRQERDGLYRAIAATVLAGHRRPVLLVDWSDLGHKQQWVMIRAAVPVGGRAITIYEQVYPFRRYNSPGAHREFLRALGRIVPSDCTPIVVTDAGFRGPWFRAVEALGWNWVGRIRNSIKYLNESTGRWCLTTSLYKHATPRTKHIGWVTLSKRRKYGCRLYLVRAYRCRPGRAPRRRWRKEGKSNVYRRLHRAPWLLATNLPHDRLMPRKVKRLYAQRMQIEEAFRDLKSHRWGMGLRYVRCSSAQRLESLLLLSTLAALVQWVCGLHVKAHGMMKHFQANTVASRAVLSVVFVGQLFLQRRDDALSAQAIDEAVASLQSLICQASPL